MSKETVRQLVFSRMVAFTPLNQDRKSYPNQPDNKPPLIGQWARVRDIEFVLHKIVGVGLEPCTRRTGVIVIDVFERLDVGTKRIFELTDAIEQHFGLWTEGNLWTDPANTVNYPNVGDKNGYYQSTVYVPFTYNVG